MSFEFEALVPKANVLNLLVGKPYSRLREEVAEWLTANCGPFGERYTYTGYKGENAIFSFFDKETATLFKLWWS